jgi:hypothetical protein
MLIKIKNINSPSIMKNIKVVNLKVEGTAIKMNSFPLEVLIKIIRIKIILIKRILKRCQIEIVKKFHLKVFKEE